jgi:hypothetical protein
MFHKTIVVLNGGNSASLNDIYRQLTVIATKLHLPVAKFTEDLQSLNGATTAIGIIVPPRIYEYAASEAYSTVNPIYPTLGITEDEHQLAVITRSCPLAR